MPTLGTLNTVLTMDASNLKRGASEAGAVTKRLGGELVDLTKKAAAVGVGLGAVGAALAAKLTKEGLAAIDTQAKLARSLKGTADGLRAVQITASDAGLDGLESSLSALNRRLGAVEAGGGPAADTLKRLGLNAQELSRLDVDERMASIADAIQQSGMSAQETARHLQQLGFTQAEAAEFFMQGGDAIRAARAEVDQYGLSLSEVDAAQVEAANDAFSRIGRTVEVIRQRLAVQLAPFIEYISELINDAAKESGGWRDQIDNAITTGIRMGARLADVVEGVRRGFLLAGQGSATMALMITRGALEAAEVIMRGPVDALNTLIRTANRVPGVSITEVVQPEIVQNTRARINAAAAAVEEGKRAMAETLAKPMPSSGLEQRLDDIRARSRAAAEQVVADRERMAAPTVQDEQEDEIDEKYRAALERRLEALQESVMAEQELLQKRHDEQLADIERFLEARMLSEDEARELAEQLEQEHQARLTEILSRGEQERQDEIGRFARANLAIRENALRSEAASLRAGLQTMFGDMKIAAQSVVGLKRLEAIASAYSWGASFGGPPAGVAAATAAGVAQARTLNAVKSSSFGGGTAGVGGVEGGEGQMAGPSSQPLETRLTLELIGGTERDNQVADGIMEMYNRAIERGERPSFMRRR